MSVQPSNSVEANGKTYRIFFLRGHMRSGTNWAGAILNLHPQINCRGEYHFRRLAAAYDDFCALPWIDAEGRAVAECARECLRDTVRRCIAAASASRPDALWQGDRTPAPIDTLLEGAPTINIVRDGRDVLVSWAFHRLKMSKPFVPEELEAWRQEFIADPELFVREPHRLLWNEEVVRGRARTWRDHVRRDLDTIESARSDPSGSPIHRITYESLHADPERTRAGMYAFLDLEPSEAATLSGESRTAPGFDRPEDPASFYRRGEIAGWRDYFSPEVSTWFKEEAGDLLIELGYEQDSNW